MKIKKMIPVFLAGMVMFTACGSNEKKGYEEAVQDLSKGSYQEALEGFREAVSNDTQVVQSYRGQGIALLKMGEYPDAIEAFQAALAQESGSKKLQGDIWMYKATAQYKNRELEEALESSHQAQALLKDGESLLLTGKIQLELAAYQDAEESFRAAVEQDNTYAMYIQVFQMYSQKDMEADGEVYLREALEIGGTKDEDYYQRGRIYFFMGDYENSKKELIEASKNGYGEAQLFLGKVYLENGDSANARAMYQEYLKDNKNSAKGYNGLSLCDMAEENYSQALENIQSGIDNAQTEDMQNLLFNQIVVYEKMQDFETAESKMETYIKLYPEDEAAQKEYQFLRNR